MTYMIFSLWLAVGALVMGLAFARSDAKPDYGRSVFLSMMFIGFIALWPIGALIVVVASELKHREERKQTDAD